MQEAGTLCGHLLRGWAKWAEAEWEGLIHGRQEDVKKNANLAIQWLGHGIPILVQGTRSHKPHGVGPHPRKRKNKQTQTGL